jgi:hypothetical protein
VAIPDDILRTWAERGGRFQPDWTTTVIREALDAGERLTGLTYRIIEQGSYPNHTNIRGSSDIDLVIQLRMPFEERIDALGDAARGRFWEKYGDTSYRLPEFRAAVLATLQNRYFATQGAKCIDIKDWDSLLRVPADVVAALEYRQYRDFPAIGPEVYEEGVYFQDGHGRPIVNFPEQHLANGKRKDRACGGRFKPMVRLIKNARSHAGKDAGQVPSYFVECLISNVEDQVLAQPLAVAFPACLDWLERHAGDLSGFLCVNGIMKLFGDHHPWTVDDAAAFVRALRRTWDEWSTA